MPAQKKMKGYCAKKNQYRTFVPGDEALVFLPLQGQPLVARYSGPYVAEQRVVDLDFMVVTRIGEKGLSLVTLIC